MFARYWAPAALAAALAGPAAAGPLTYTEALAKAQASAPALVAAGLRTEAARREAVAAGRLPDPQLRIALENFPVSGPMAGSLGGDEMTMATIGVMQTFPNRARRRAETDGARASAASALAQEAITGREIRVATALAWIDLYYAQARLSALNAVLAELTPLWDAAPAAVANASSRPAAALMPIRLRAGLDDQRDGLTAAVGRAQAELTRWTGEASPQASGAPPPSHITPETLKADLPKHSTLAAYDAESRRAAAAVDLARSETRPDFGVEAGYGRRDPMFGDMISAGVTVRLPLYSSRRQGPVIGARQADAARIDIEREVARRDLAAAFEVDLADHVMHHDQWLRARDVLVPAARQQADLETASYAAGRASLSDVLQAFTDVAQTRLTVLEREAAVARDAVRITLTYGAEP